MFSLNGQLYALSRGCTRVLKMSSTGTWEHTPAIVPSRLANVDRETCVFTWTHESISPDLARDRAACTAYLYQLSQGSLFLIDSTLSFKAIGSGPVGHQGVIAATHSHIYIILTETTVASAPGHSRVYVFELETHIFSSTDIDINGVPLFAHSFEGTILLLVLRRKGTHSELGILKLLKKGNKITVNELIVDDAVCDAYHMTVIFQNRYILSFFQASGRELVRVYDSISGVFIMFPSNIRPALFTDVTGVVHKKLCRIIMRTGSIDLPEEIIDILYRINACKTESSSTIPIPQAEFHPNGAQPSTPRALFTKNPLFSLNGSLQVSNIPLIEGTLSRMLTRRSSSSQRAATPTMNYTLTALSPARGSNTKTQKAYRSVSANASSNTAPVGPQSKPGAHCNQEIVPLGVKALQSEMALLKGRNIQLEQELHKTRSEVLELKAQVFYLTDIVESLKQRVPRTAYG
ncbi:hypothetical protein GL50803_009090 [Giardia duodenalis]|uniref:Uncharacterized protein n=1 Tax=Giardia intestinalis (strain ATCC 50803 / WB clone C6) TaxID=184922 RepID=D3KGN4_GIAIC|nr:hypothetical protein GL50803_009090 [Giardia intestinalis]KAE8302312.1 hypothetical protein GL50803_009090 [Giardia intestinalis]